MKKLTVCFTFLITFAALAISVRAQDVVRADIGARMPIEAKIVKGAPYSAEISSEHSQTLSDGNRIFRRSMGRVYRDSDGRVRREEDSPSGQALVSITDPVANVSYSLDAENHIAWVTPAPGGMAGTMIHLQPGRPGFFAVIQGGVASTGLPELKGDVLALKHEALHAAAREDQSQIKLAPRVIEGVQSDGSRTTTTIPAGAIGNDQPIVIVSEEWISPDLQVLIASEHSDPRMGTSTYRLTNILKIEPNRSLFEVPPDYTVQKSAFATKPALPPPPPPPPR